MTKRVPAAVPAAVGGAEGRTSEAGPQSTTETATVGSRR